MSATFGDASRGSILHRHTSYILFAPALPPPLSPPAPPSPPPTAPSLHHSPEMMSTLRAHTQKFSGAMWMCKKEEGKKRDVEKREGPCVHMSTLCAHTQKHRGCGKIAHARDCFFLWSYCCTEWLCTVVWWGTDELCCGILLWYEKLWCSNCDAENL